MLKIDLLAVGTKAPAWVVEGVDAYTGRMKRECRFSIRELKTADRNKPQSIEQYKNDEADRLLAEVTSGAKVIALDKNGRNWSTEDLAGKLNSWSLETNHLQFMIGGPDGLAKSCLQACDDIWSLSNLTFPHFLVRVLLAEQIYRALMINANHPYHK